MTVTSANVTVDDQATSTQYNNLRTDLLHHNHDGWIGAASMSAYAGSPTATVVGTQPIPVWSMPDSSTTGVGGTMVVPSDWESQTYTIKGWWTNGGAGSGNVVLSWAKLSASDGDSLSASSGSLAAVAAPGEDVLEVTTLTTLAMTPGDVLCLGFGRTGGDAADTLTNAIEILGISIVPA